MPMKRTLTATAAFSMLLGPAYSAAASEGFEDLVMFGIDRDTGAFWKHDFNEGNDTLIGHVHDPETKQAFSGIDGSAYVPGFDSLFAFQWDASDHQARMLWVSVGKHAKGQVTGHYNLEGGPIGGATSFRDDDGNVTIYAVQHELAEPPERLEGHVELNPNNRDDMHFELETKDGRIFTRQTLHDATQNDLDDKYLLREEDVVRFEIRPMGQGNQNSLVLGDEETPLENSNLYTFIGDMTISVYNERLRDNPNANSMGHWELKVDGDVHLDDPEMLSPHRLVKITHRPEVVVNDEGEEVTYQPGRVIQLGGELQQSYDSLATLDGVHFYATKGQHFWQIRIDSETSITETQMSSISDASTPVLGMSQGNGRMFGFRHNADRLGLIRVNPAEQNANIVDERAFDSISNLGTVTLTLKDRSEVAYMGYD